MTEPLDNKDLENLEDLEDPAEGLAADAGDTAEEAAAPNQGSRTASAGDSQQTRPIRQI